MSSSKAKSSKKDDTSNPDLNVAQIGNYVFSKTLGEGNFAKVKLATHKITHAEVSDNMAYNIRLQSKLLTRLTWMKRNWVNCIEK